MRRGLCLLSCLLVVTSVGCIGPKTYRVRFTNNAALPTDFRVDDFGIALDSFALDVAGNGGKVTVTHDGRSPSVTIDSGVAQGQEMLIIQTQCAVEVADGDTVDVTKLPSGELECIVYPDIPPDEQRQAAPAGKSRRK